jgi:hypothetical protein
MMRLFQRTLLALALAGAVNSASAFSMLGPFDTWQVTAIGYNLSPYIGDIGGPMNWAQGYRWNVKTIYYGFDQSFKDYFGQQGMDAVRKAMAVFNKLPPFSQMSSNLAEYPTDSKRINYQASALFIYDMKSIVMGAILEELGLASPERYAWCLRSTATIGTVTYYNVIMRNFDPTKPGPSPSAYVNGTLYTYVIYSTTNAPGFVDAGEIPVDPLAFTYTSVASADGGLYGGGASAGEFYPSLTRDDVGGLRCLYAGTGPYTKIFYENPVTGVLSNAVSSDPWTPIGGTNTNTIVTTALRPGVDKITFVEGQNDSIFGSFIPVTNSYTDSYYTNSTLKTQSIQRVLTAPDILFAAGDVGLNTAGGPVMWSRSTPAWVNNAALNSQTVTAGPGVIQPQTVITFNNVGPWLQNSTPSSLNQATASQGWVLGSFDATTNDIVIFPNYFSVQQLEQMILGRP